MYHHGHYDYCVKKVISAPIINFSPSSPLLLYYIRWPLCEYIKYCGDHSEHLWNTNIHYVVAVDSGI